MRTTGQQHQHGGGWCLVEHQVQQFEGRRVRPVQVFDNEEHRLSFGQFQEDRDDSFQRLLALTLGRESERSDNGFQAGATTGKAQRADSFLEGKSVLAQRVFKFLQFLVSGVLCVELQEPLEQINQRKQGGVLIIRYTSAFPPGMRLVGNMLFQHLDQTTLTNACLTRK